MSSISPAYAATTGTRNDRLAGIGVTLAVHLALILAWQMAGKLPLTAQEGSDEAMQWLTLPALPPRAEPAAPEPVKEVLPAPAAAPARAGRSIPGPVSPVSPASPVEEVPTAADEQPAAPPGAAEILANARRSVGEIDRALRKENKPLIVLPPDSPQIRMANKFRETAALAPNKWYEAPKIVELVNDGGDGARRFRVLTALGIYCVTERSPATSIDMIEKHGKQRITNCGHEHEQPANPQEWRTARD